MWKASFFSLWGSQASRFQGTIIDTKMTHLHCAFGEMSGLLDLSRALLIAISSRVIFK
jgi:hypothetical protein